MSRFRPALCDIHGYRAWRLLVLVCLLLAPMLGRAADDCHNQPVIVDDYTEHVTLGGCLWFLEDPRHELTLEDVRTYNPGASDFQEHHEGTLNFGYTESSYWVRFDLRYQGDRSVRDFILELVLPLADEVDLYLEQGGEIIEERQLRYDHSWDQRDLQLPNPNFTLALDQGQLVTGYIRIYTQNTFRLPLHLWSAEAYAEDVALTELIHGAFLGAMLAIFAYNLFVTLVVRERGYVFYMLYLLFATLFVLTEQVHGQQIFGGQLTLLDKNYLPYWIILAWFWSILMARDLLETRARAPGLDMMLKLAQHGVVATLVLSFAIRYHVSMQWTVIGSVLLVVLMLFVGYRAVRMNVPSARIYLSAWSAVLGSVGLYAITVMGYLPVNNFTAHTPQLGFASQIILLSFAMARRIKVVQEQALLWNQSAVANLQRYRSLFDNAIEGIFQMSPGCRFIEANPALARMLGYSSVRALLRQSPHVLETCFADPAIRFRVRQQLETRGYFKGVEASYFNRQGEERWASISLRTLYDQAGEPTHLEGTFVDVTERKQREMVERERENERLEKELARSSAASKSQFLANMSHEIRTPLAAIIGYGETLLEPDLDPREKRHSAETVVRSGRHLLDLINDILDHSKIEANKLDVEVLPVNLPELLDDIRSVFGPKAREKGLDFSVTCAFPLPEVIHTDPTRFRQILINLCGNALKFTEQGSISVQVHCRPEAQCLVARVVDTGIGMKPEQLERLFDPFAQGSSAIARQYGGTGLGLSISKRLAELLGGSIHASSRYGEGSEFEIRLATGPLDQVRFLQDGSELEARQERMPLVKTPRLRGRILYAEDNEVNRKLVHLMVSRTGADIVHVNNGAEALDAGLRESFDLILMDIQMPVMDGRDATRALRQAGVNTPVVALTANVMAEDIQDYREAGCTEFLAKPIDKGRFYEILARYLLPEDAEAPRRFEGLVLVAEQNPDNRRLLERMLQRSGLSSIAAQTGPEAVQAAMSSTVHLVLMDSRLPEMAGPEAIRLLRQAGFLRPVVALTGGDPDEDEALRAAGSSNVLHKPVNQNELMALLEQYLPSAPTNTDNANNDQEPEEDEAIAGLIRRFLAELPGRLTRMRQDCDAENWPALQREAHQIKGSAGAMGYPLMTEQAARLELALREEAYDQAHQALVALEAMINQAVAPEARP